MCLCVSDDAGRVWAASVAGCHDGAAFEGSFAHPAVALVDLVESEPFDVRGDAAAGAERVHLEQLRLGSPKMDDVLVSYGVAP